MSKNQLAVISGFPTTKKDFAKFKEGIKSTILEGNISYLQVAIRLKTMTDILKFLKDDPDIRAAILNEADTHGEKSFSVYGSKFSIKEAGTKYDFTVCGDPDWDELNKIISDATIKIKEREDFLKAVKKPVADPETGAIINPPSKTSTTTVAVTLI